MERAYSGNDTWGRVVENGLMLLWCLYEALYPGLTADGVLTALQHFYDERYFRPANIFRVLKKARFDGYERQRSRKDAKPFLKLRSKGTELVENSAKKTST
jgi:hypothetical protein